MSEEIEPLGKIMIPVFASIAGLILSVIPVLFPRLQFPLQLIVGALTALSGAIIFLSDGIPKSVMHTILMT